MCRVECCLTLLPILALVGPPRTSAEGASSPPLRRGPIESREEWLLVQNRLILPPVSPDLLGRGETRLRLDLDWGSDFGWDQEMKGEVPGDRRFLVDGEHRTLALDVQRGISDAVSVGVRLPLRWRGGGILDGIIDGFHEKVTLPLGLPDNGRPQFATDQFRASGRDDQLRPVVWRGRAGTGLGRVELSAQWNVHGRDRSGFAGALVGRVGLPTGGGAFHASGIEGGLQWVAACPLGRRADVYLGAGGVLFGDTEVDGVRYERARLHAFAVLEWRPFRRLSVLVQTDGSSRLVTNLARYPAFQSYLKIGGKVDLPAKTSLEGGFSEGLFGQDVTTDFGIFLGLTRKF